MSDITAPAQSFGITNVSGQLFKLGEGRTPLVNSLARKQTSSVRFAVNSQYQMRQAGIPAISETASMVAPAVTSKARKQEYNVTQIFQESFGVSYAKLSNTGALSGINVAGQASNVQDEWDFQASVKVQDMRNDLEYTLLHGVYNEAEADDEVNQTRGFYDAVPTENYIEVVGNGKLTLDAVRQVAQRMYADNVSMQGVVALVHMQDLVDLGVDIKNQGQALPLDRTVAGWNFTDVVTEAGIVSFALHPYAAQGRVLFFKPGQCAIVEQPIPGKGNVFVEQIPTAGASYQGQVFAQFGLDYANSADLYSLFMVR